MPGGGIACSNGNMCQWLAKAARTFLIAAALIAPTPSVLGETPPTQASVEKQLIDARSQLEALLKDERLVPEMALLKAAREFIASLAPLDKRPGTLDAERAAWLEIWLSRAKIVVEANCDQAPCGLLEGRRATDARALIKSLILTLNDAARPALFAEFVEQATKTMPTSDFGNAALREVIGELAKTYAARDNAAAAAFAGHLASTINASTNVGPDLHRQLQELLTKYQSEALKARQQESALKSIAQPLEQLLKDAATKMRLDANADKALLASLLAIHDQLSTLLRKPNVPRLYILDAWTGDIDQLLPRLAAYQHSSPAGFERRTSRSCISTRAVRAKCMGKQICSLGTSISDLCGYDPVPHADASIKGTVVHFECLRTTDDEWDVLATTYDGKAQGKGGRRVGTFQRAVLMSGAGSTQTLQCTVNEPDAKKSSTPLAVGAPQ
ncbi:MAG: hypothetical protein J0I42_07365 [Bosea sp.]|uniref:hypothetical protein n=1 Tax=Bosea sp. (in: a-proteobacteria) TaxID=1871050 RepID=UPI001AC6DBE1|nr:hypothetical protein [Bosea sp. (in: a-proteobacteria)]MBN9451756.1 hypothetical protein [Bosea sp. (in: a-proteobacteria)]